MSSLCRMVALHDLHWNSYFLTRWFVNNISSSTTCFYDMKVISKFKPITTSLLLIKHHPWCSKINNYTTHTYYTIILHFLVWPMLWEPVEKSGYKHTHYTNWTYVKIILFFLPFQSESTIPDQILFFESPKFSLSLFNCSCSPMNVKMEQKGQP